MKFGVDIHGCLDTITDTLKEIMCSLVNRNNEVHLITGIPFKHIKNKLDRLGIKIGVHYTHFFSIEEYLISKESKVIRKDKKGRNIYDENEWNVCKANYCYLNNIDLMIDDSSIYKKYFVTPYAKLTI